MKISEINFVDIEENDEYVELAEEVLEKCFSEEKLQDKNLFVNVLFTNSKNIKEINYSHRNINQETDVLSFPMFSREEIENIKGEYLDVLGDIIISIEVVKKQAEEYNHSFKRELAYMLVHGFYHLIGYDHINEDDKILMRKNEEKILEALEILR